MGISSGILTEVWKDPPFLMGKSTISMVIFNSYVRFDRLDMVFFVYLNMVHDSNVGGVGPF